MSVPFVVPVQTLVIFPPAMGAATNAAGFANATTTTINAAPSSPTPAPHASATRALLCEAQRGTSHPVWPDDSGLGSIVAITDPRSQNSGAKHHRRADTIGRTTPNGGMSLRGRSPIWMRCRFGAGLNAEKVCLKRR